MSKLMFIPSKLKIGFQLRSDTFTGKLAYVIYYDEKNKLRKEKSWNSWRDENIPIVELDNKPISGFVINKGQKRSAEWFGSGRTMIRIHHPDGFEFEITIDNLVNIMMHSDINRCDIQQECILAWFGTELVLLPTNSQEYQSSLVHTSNQSSTVKANQLLEGRRYMTKKEAREVVYLGRHKHYSNVCRYVDGITRTLITVKLRHVFASMHGIEAREPSTLSRMLSDAVDPEYLTLLEAYSQSSFTRGPDKFVGSVPLTLDWLRDIPPYTHYHRVYNITDNGKTVRRLSIGLCRVEDTYRVSSLYSQRYELVHNDEGGSTIFSNHYTHTALDSDVKAMLQKYGVNVYSHHISVILNIEDFFKILTELDFVHTKVALHDTDDKQLDYWSFA